MTVTPRTPPGVLELLPPQQLAFQRMLDTIRRGFERFGFLPVETPVFELTDVLLTKTGGETEKQVYFVQSTGALAANKAPEMALRFDLTVPLARYVAEHEHALAFPFRRYQIQRVYRGERNQKGRFREFYQCDIDVIGKDSLPTSYDAELPAVIHGIFTELGIGAFTIYINNRRLLRGLLEAIGIAADKHEAVLHEVDRIRKQPRETIETSIAAIVGEARQAKLLLDTLTADADADAQHTFDKLARLENPTPAFTEGLAELKRVYEGTLALGAKCKLDLSIVRGLDYYTGTVYETFLDEHPNLGSICSGGRYDNLAGHYTKSKLPGVGISIGATRLFWQLMELGKLPHAASAMADVLILLPDESAALACSRLAAELRGVEVRVDQYGAADKLGKQLKYADKSKIPLAIIYSGGDLVKVKDFRVTTERAPEVEVPRAGIVEHVLTMLGRRP